MKTGWNLIALASAALGIMASGCAPVPPPATPLPGPSAPAVGDDRDAIAPADDPLGDPASKVVYVSQNWSPADSQRFYFTTQGSEIVPYDWFLVLEQSESTTPFRDNQNILKYRYLPQKPDDKNPDGLPVGFVKDPGSGRAWLGLTCAACHTAEIHYKGTAYRIDGGPAMADIASFHRALTAALTATRDTPDKFDRFARAVLKDKDGPVARATLMAQLGLVIDRCSGYDARNFLPGLAGFGRIDAFGAILNEVFYHAVPAAKLTSPTVGAVPADAPVSIPFLWDTPQHDILQWNGSAVNGGPGNVGGLARNVGEVLGVFGDFVIPEDPGPFGYSSSVQVQDLMSLESWVTTLWSPQWPADFPAIDPAKRDRGRALYVANCVKCHADINRADPNRTVKAVMWGSGTDWLMANNFASRAGASGKLEGSYELFAPFAGAKIGATASGAVLLHNVVIGVIVGSPFSAPADDLAKIELAKAPKPPEALAVPTGESGPRYKARPLDGIWATAPFLHNGSVPSLADLLKPPADRPKSFSVGSREFDPVAVGFRQDAPNVFTFDATRPGNSNAGHPYGTDLPADGKADLLEYLKSL